MRCGMLALLTAGTIALAEFAFSPLAAMAEDRPQKQAYCRYTFRNGEWWYWLPENRWVFWRDNRWNDYNRLTFVPNRSPGFVRNGYAGSAYGSQVIVNSDIPPFYGCAKSHAGISASSWGETGPFYGHCAARGDPKRSGFT